MRVVVRLMFSSQEPEVNIGSMGDAYAQHINVQMINDIK